MEESEGDQDSDPAEGGKGNSAGPEFIHDDGYHVHASPRAPDFDLMRRMGLSPNTPVAPAYVQALEHVDRTAAPEADRPSECDEHDVAARLAEVEFLDWARKNFIYSLIVQPCLKQLNPKLEIRNPAPRLNTLKPAPTEATSCGSQS